MLFPYNNALSWDTGKRTVLYSNNQSRLKFHQIRRHITRRRIRVYTVYKISSIFMISNERLTDLFKLRET